MHAFKRFNQGLLALPLHLRAWVLLLISVNLVTPFFFLEHVEAQAVLAAGALGMVLMTALTGRFGFSRIIGVGHIAWLPLLGFLWIRLADVPATDTFGLWLRAVIVLWLRAVIVLDAISLGLDALDVVRFLRGDRAETVLGLQPPFEAIGSRA
jgi:hypothetical protein